MKFAAFSSAFASFVLVFGMFIGSAFAQRDPGFDPFAAPPKNLQEDSVSFAQSVDNDVQETPLLGKIDDTHYAGILQSSNREVEGYHTYELNIGEGKQVPLNTKKDLENLIGEQITIEIARTQDGIILKSVTVMSAGETFQMTESGDLHSAPTGPKSWLLVPFVLLVIAALVASGVFTRMGIFSRRKSE